MAAPTGRVPGIAIVVRGGEIQDIFDAALHTLGRFGLRVPDRRQDPEHVLGLNGVHAFGADHGPGIRLQRPDPLPGSVLICLDRSEFVQLPYVIRESCFHRWRHAQSLMYASEVVVGEV